MFKLEPRPQASAFWSVASPLLALLVTVAIGIVLFVALGKDPVRGLQMFFWEPVKSAYALGELMVKATPLLLIALGLAVCFRSNVWNIGAEGQFVIGAICAGGVALTATKDSSQWIVLGILLAGIAGGMAWAGLTAFLRDKFNANEILVSLMLVYVAEMLLSYLVYGPWKDPAGYNFPQTITFLEAITVLGPRSLEQVRQAAIATLAPQPQQRETFDALFSTNVRGPYFLMQEAIKLMIVLDRRGYVTRRDMKALEISATRWTDRYHGFLMPGPSGYVRCNATPDLKAQHPINYAQIEADIDQWASKLDPLDPSEGQLFGEPK